MNGSFSVKINNATCVDTSSCYNFNTLNLQEKIGFNDLLIYPNPTNGVLHIVLKENKDYLQVKLNDITGKIVYQATFFDTSNFSCYSNLENGTYELELSDGVGNYYRQKLVVIN
jgi:hypothetical protein